MKKQLLLGAALIGGMFTSQAQLSETFDGTTFPPEGWTVESLNTSTWLRTTGTQAITGAGSAGVFYDNVAPTTDQAEYLISPEFTVNGAATTLNFNIALSYTWAITNGMYDVIVSVSSNAGTTWTPIWDETDLGVFTNGSINAVSVPLGDYDGDTIMLRFGYEGNDGDFVFLDDINVVACATPTGFTYLQTPTTTTASLGWSAIAGAEGYTFEYGVRGFTQGTGSTILNPTEPSVALENLSPSTVYEFYVQTNCSGTDVSEWVGPIAFNTVFEAVNPPYATGFEDDNLDFIGWNYLRVGNTGTMWESVASDDDFEAYEGESLAVAGANGGASDAWMFSRGLNLTQGANVTVTYWVRKIALVGAGNVNNLEVTFGTDDTAEAQTNVLATFDDYADESYTQQTHTFTAPSTGVYYIGFNYTAPAHVATDFGVIAVDNFAVTSTMSNNEVLASQLSVFPNPSSNVINVTNNNNILVDGIQIVDLNGRTVKSAKFAGVTEAQVNISDLANGIYMMTVSSDKGTMTQKIVKN